MVNTESELGTIGNGGIFGGGGAGALLERRNGKGALAVCLMLVLLPRVGTINCFHVDVFYVITISTSLILIGCVLIYFVSCLARTCTCEEKIFLKSPFLRCIQ